MPNRWLLTLNFFSSALLFTSCTRLPVQIESSFISRENLASYHIRTPDPLLNCSNVGQRLLLTWGLPASVARDPSSRITMTIIFGNYEVKEIVLRPCSTWGTYDFLLVDKEYFAKCGILTYKAEIWKDGSLLYSWKHQLWAELITFPSLDQPEPLIELE